MTRGPGKEHGINKPPPTGRVQERSKGDTTCPTTSQNPLWHPSWLNKTCTTRKDSESEWLAKDNPETNPITIKLETASHVAEQFSWVLWPSCSPPRCPFPKKSLAMPARVSPRTIHIRMLDQSQVSGPGRGPPSCNTHTHTHKSNPNPNLKHRFCIRPGFVIPTPQCTHTVMCPLWLKTTSVLFVSASIWHLSQR